MNELFQQATWKRLGSFNETAVLATCVDTEQLISTGESLALTGVERGCFRFSTPICV